MHMIRPATHCAGRSCVRAAVGGTAARDIIRQFQEKCEAVFRPEIA